MREGILVLIYIVSNCSTLLSDEVSPCVDSQQTARTLGWSASNMRVLVRVILDMWNSPRQDPSTSIPQLPLLVCAYVDNCSYIPSSFIETDHLTSQLCGSVFKHAIVRQIVAGYNSTQISMRSTPLPTNPKKCPFQVAYSAGYDCTASPSIATPSEDTAMTHERRSPTMAHTTPKTLHSPSDFVVSICA